MRCSRVNSMCGNVLRLTVTSRSARRVVAIGGVLAILAAGCSDDDDTGRASQSTTAVASTSTTPRPRAGRGGEGTDHGQERSVHG
jgi:hypothetical protein